VLYYDEQMDLSDDTDTVHWHSTDVTIIPDLGGMFS
jgi:hypothetical protein